MKHILKILGLCMVIAGFISLQGCDSKDQGTQSEETGDNDIIFGPDGLICNAAYTAGTDLEKNFLKKLGGGCERPWPKSKGNSHDSK